MSGPTSAPYWGQLPPPKARRPSDSGSLTPDRRQSLDAHPQSRANRESVQTTNTDTLTDTTFSSLASPNRSSFQGQGLAPRPPSLPYGANQYPPELLENRRRRRSTKQDDNYTQGPPPRTASDGPRAPPVSYRALDGNGALPYTYAAPGAASRTARRPDGPVSSMEQSPRAATFADGQGGLPLVARARNAGDPSSDSRNRRNGTDPTSARSAPTTDMAGAQRQRRGSVGDAARPQRRDSQGQPSARRPYANGRSPLQRLELTLDSITKEEKRTLAEAAERAAREKAASGNRPVPKADRGPPIPPKDQPAQQVRFRDPGAPLAIEVPRTGNAGGSSTDNTPATPRGPLSQHPPEEGRRYSASAVRSPQTRAPESRIPVPAPQTKAQAVTQASGVPQRNLSFRERAAKNDAKLPAGIENEIPASPLVATPGSAGTIPRSGSNRLRKNPPASYAPGAAGDPYARKQVDAQNYIMAQQAQSGPGNNSEARVRTVGFAAPGPAGPQMRPRTVDQTEPLAPSSGRPAAHDRQVMPSAAVGELSRPQGSQSRNDSSLTRASAQNTAAQRAGSGPGNNTQAAVLMAGAAGVAVAAGAQHHRAMRDDTRSDSDSGDEQHRRHVSNLVYGHGREQFRPGQGMYQPPTYLDEWKKATVGTLSGALLDLDDNEPANVTVEKDKPWWETPPSQRRGSVAARPRKAEAFDGEYDDTHGM